jgi:hypothetical protein
LIKERFDHVIDLNGVGLDDVFDQTFIRQLLVGTDGAQEPLACITDFHDRNPFLKPNPTTRIFGDRNVYCQAARSYITNLKNALRVEVDRRIRTFCKNFQTLHGLGKFEKIALLYGINGWEISRSLPRGIFPIQEATADAINEHRLVLGLAQGAKLSKGWLISNGCLAPLLRYNVLLLRFYETHGFKLFNVVPMCKIKRHFIDIDTFGLFGILKEVGIVNCNETIFETLRDEHWLATFRIPKL